MSKHINAGDTLTVGDLTDDHLGAFIEVGPTDGGITFGFRIDRIECYGTSRVKMLTTEGRCTVCLEKARAGRDEAFPVPAPTPELSAYLNRRRERLARRARVMAA